VNAAHAHSYHFRCIIYCVSAIALLVSNSIFAQSAIPQATNSHNLFQEYSSRIKHWYYKTGDDSTWSVQQLNMAGWKSVANQHDGEYYPGIQWYRADIHLEGTQNEFDILAISVVGLVSAFELYWDGHLIDTDGALANSLT